MPTLSLTPELLASPAPTAARDVARDRLQKALEQAARLEVRPDEPLVTPPGSPEHPVVTDQEAVHDFRVALRRLRTWLRAFRPWLDSTVTRRTEQKFRRLWRRASAAREQQVAATTLREIAEHGPEPIRIAAQAIANDLTEKASRAQQRLARNIARRLPKAATRLAVQLEPVMSEPDQVAMKRAMANLLVSHLGKLERDLTRFVRGRTLEQAHRVRIRAKRLRYLLDAFGEESRAAQSAVRHLQKVQNAFGALHDAQVLHALVEKRALAEPAHRTNPLGPLRQLLARRMREAFAVTTRVAGSHEFSAVHSATERLVRSLLKGERQLAA